MIAVQVRDEDRVRGLDRSRGDAGPARERPEPAAEKRVGEQASAELEDLDRCVTDEPDSVGLR